MPTTTLSLLARKASSGDEEALEELLGNLRPMIVRATRLIVGSGSWVAEDAAQEAMVDIARAIRRLREPEAIEGWALKVATRRAIKIARRERFLSLHRAPLIDRDISTDAADPRAEALKAAFDRLPTRMRATAVLRLYLGLGERETAETLGCSIGTVKSTLHEARRRLSSALAADGFLPNAQPRPPREEIAR